jgi:cation:H+ antiporter
MTHLAVFVLAGLVVVIAGVWLARSGDAIGRRTGVGGLWIGAVLLAGATSLPELATDVSAVRIGDPDLAVGDLFGSSMANMLILAAVDLLSPGRQVLRRATLDHALSACLAIVLTAVATLLVVAGPGPSLAGVGIGPALLAVLYLLGTRAVYRHATRRGPDAPSRGAPDESGPTLRAAVVGYLVSAAAILLAAPAFAWAAHVLAERSGLGSTFFGTWLVGLATSLPEMVASLAAVRLGAYDAAVGNLFGSNGFNMAIFVVLDAVHTGGPLFAAVSPAHAVTGLFGVVLTALGLSAIVYRAERRFAMIEPDSVAIVLAYVLGMLLLFLQRGG